MAGIVDAIKAKVGKALDVAQPIRPAAGAVGLLPDPETCGCGSAQGK